MLLCTALPWALCALLFSGLHVTYKRDRIAAAAYQRARSGYASLTLPPPEEFELDEEGEAHEAAALATLGTRRMPLPGGLAPRSRLQTDA